MISQQPQSGYMQEGEEALMKLFGGGEPGAEEETVHLANAMIRFVGIFECPHFVGRLW